MGLVRLEHGRSATWERELNGGNDVVREPEKTKGNRARIGKTGSRGPATTLGPLDSENNYFGPPGAP